MSAAHEQAAEALILIVEDSRTQAEHLLHILESSGYRVLAAANGQEALSLARRDPPRLIITDVVMPIMNGYAMCRALKDDDTLNRIPVIMLTSLSDPKDVILGIEAGVDYYLTKPYETDALLSKIKTIVTASGPRDTEDAEERFAVTIAGEKKILRTSRQRLLTLLLSTYESAVAHNEVLVSAQRDLGTLNRKLEGLVEELAEAKRAADAANLAKGSFLANMSHEIRTPLNAVIGFTSLALKTDLTPQQMDYLTKIHNAGVSLLGLINDILDFSKIEAGRLSIEQVSFTLESVMVNVMSFTTQSAFGKDLELLLNIHPERPSGPDRRSSPARPGPHQPYRKCREIHRLGGSGAESHPARQNGREDKVAILDPRYGYWNE